MKEILAKIIIAPIIALMSLAGYNITTTESPLGATLPISGQTYTIAGSGLTSAATSITLSSLTIPQTGYKILDADLSDTFYITLEPGNRTKQEIVSCTTVTQNANNTATLSGCSRGLLPISPYTASSTYAFAHGGGTSVIFSNPPQLYNQFAAKSNDEIITGSWSFPEPTSASNTATKNYVDDKVFAGIPEASSVAGGFSELATATEIASSTAQGGDAVLVIPATLSTSTAPTSGHVVPVTGIDGNLAEGFLPTTLAQNYTLTGSSTFTGTTTFSGLVYGLYGNFGDGSDGVLNITSGTTTINLGGLDIVEKNYTSINISSGAVLNFSNPNANGTKIVLKSKGNVTIAGTIDASGMGGAGGAAGVDGKQNNGKLGTERMYGLYGNVTSDGHSAPGEVMTLLPFYAVTKYSLLSGFVHIIPGAGGGGGNSQNTAGGTGGNGGGAVLILCNGYLNFTGTIDTSGLSGGSSSNATNDSSGGGGGGGSAGMVLVLYNYLTSNTGTINAIGGNGGNSGSNSDGSVSGLTAEGGGGASSYYGAGHSGNLGTGGRGANGVRGTTSGGTGGTGGASMGGLVIKNTLF